MSGGGRGLTYGGGHGRGSCLPLLAPIWFSGAVEALSTTTVGMRGFFGAPIFFDPPHGIALWRWGYFPNSALVVFHVFVTRCPVDR